MGEEPDITVEEFFFPGEVVEIIEPESPRSTSLEPQPPRPYSCCGQIICECTRNTPISYPSEDEKRPKELENDNGWGPEYYNDNEG